MVKVMRKPLNDDKMKCYKCNAKDNLESIGIQISKGEEWIWHTRYLCPNCIKEFKGITMQKTKVSDI